MTDNFHPKSDVDRLYISRNKGGRGLKNIRTLFESRIIAIHQHLKLNSTRNEILQYVNECEADAINRIADELLQQANINPEKNEKPKRLSRKFNLQKSEQRNERYTNKVIHGYFQRKLKDDSKIDHKTSLQRNKNRSTSSHFNSYLDSIVDQELPTRYIQHKRQQIDNNRCRLCRSNVEDIIHITNGCPKMSARYYLPLRHDALAKYVLKAVIRKKHPEHQYCNSRDPEYVLKLDNVEYWWNLSVKTITKVPHNKPDIIIWDNSAKICSVVEVSCPTDINIGNKIEEKMNNYAPLLRNMQIMYPEYRFKMLPIIVGALGYVPKCLQEAMEELGFDKKESTVHINKKQNIVTSGTVKIC